MESVSRIFILAMICNLFIIIIFMIFIRKIVNTNAVSNKLKKIIAVVYCVILLISLLIVSVLPNNKFIEMESDSSINKLMCDIQDFRQLAIDGKLSSSEQFVKKSASSFKYNGKQLKIDGTADGKVEILVQHKKQDDGKIEAEDYAEKFIFNGIDVSSLLQPLSVKLESDTLVITKNPEKQIVIKKFGNDLTAVQFIKDSSPQKEFYGTSGNARKILIKIPSSVQIDSDYNIIEAVKNGGGKD